MTDELDDLFDIPGDVLAAASAASSFALIAPDNARTARRDPRIKMWPESGIIKSAYSSSYFNEAHKQKVSTLVFDTELTAEGSGLNANRLLTTTLRLNKAALKTGEPKKQLTMTLMSIDKLNSLLGALGIEQDMPNGGYSKALQDHYFPPQTDQFPVDTSPLIGSTIYFEVRQRPTDQQDGSVKDQAEISKILKGGFANE